jgi:SAM-dependent methyltransferase
VSDAPAYWNRVADEKTFTHPLSAAWLAGWVEPGARILDYGCGYGRVLRDLAELGHANAVGVDRSAAMIERGLREHPDLDLRITQGSHAPFGDRSFDLVLLFAVLTCIVADEDQRGLIADAARLLRPGALLYLSDMPLQTDARNRERYAADAQRFGVHGVFATDDGGVLRHHADEHFDELLAGFDVIERETRDARTMHGNPATIVQILARCPP